MWRRGLRCAGAAFGGLTAVHANAPYGESPNITPDAWRSFLLESRTPLADNVYRFRVHFSDPRERAAIGPGVHSIQVRTKDYATGEWLNREVYPSGNPTHPGSLEFAVEGHYRGDKYMDTITVQPMNEPVQIRGPFTKFSYEKGMAKHVVMIGEAGRNAAFMRLLYDIMQDPADKTRLTLIRTLNTAFNCTYHQQVRELAVHLPGQLTVKNVMRVPLQYMVKSGALTHGPERDFEGSLDSSIVRACGVTDPKNTIVLVAQGEEGAERLLGKGPAGWQNPETFDGILAELGFNPNQVFKLTTEDYPDNPKLTSHEWGLFAPFTQLSHLQGFSSSPSVHRNGEFPRL